MENYRKKLQLRLAGKTGIAIIYLSGLTVIVLQLKSLM